MTGVPQASDLVATWRLVAWENVTAAGVSQPMGPDPVGHISYDAGGRMSVQVMRRGRNGLAADDVAEADADLLREVLGGYLAYSGGYAVDAAAGTVSHRIDCALMPAQVGTELTRWFEIDGVRLTLYLSPPGAGPRRGGRVVWERVD